MLKTKISIFAQFLTNKNFSFDETYFTLTASQLG